MAETNLRAYVSEIEDLVEHNQLDEAVAHCRHILSIYPKHLETYRILAKALLEHGRHSDAADIFQRVHSVAPDDFLAHVGMGIIREDDGNLDGAIWHMERAFEAQPSNAVIQEELRRLYGRRDGLEPAKIHYTRGALARTYAKGGLYAQAIAELQAGLAEEPDRLDLKVAYADMLWRNNDKQRAADVCTALLEKLPYCRQANAIMAQIMRAAGQMDQYRTYQARVEAVDPYEAFTDDTGDSDSAASVPPQAIRLQKLQWSPQTEGQRGSGGPEWMAALGISLEPAATGAVPDWMTEPAGSRPPVVDDAPDWLTGLRASQPAEPERDPLVDTGWLRTLRAEAGETKPPDYTAPVEEPADDEPQEWQARTSFDSPTLIHTGGAVPADEPPAPPAEASPFHDDTPDWLQEASRPAGVDPLPDWLSSIETEPAAASTLSADAPLPDWIKLSDLQPPAEPPAAAPAAPLAATEPAGEPEWFQPERTSSDSSLPSWLTESDITPPAGSVEPAATSSGGPEPDAWTKLTTGRLRDLPEFGERASSPEDLLTPAEPVEAAELPDWLRSLAPAPEPEAPAAPPEAALELPGFLQDKPPGASDTIAGWLRERQPETPAEPAQPAEDVPAWLRDVLSSPSDASAGEVEAPAPPPPTPAETPTFIAPSRFSTSSLAPAESHVEPTPEPGLTFESKVEPVEPELAIESDTLAWLESLAAKHGDAPEEAAAPAEPAAHAADMPDWLRTGLAGQPAVEEPEESAADLASLLGALAATGPAAAAPVEAPLPAQEAATEDDAMAWLEALAAQQTTPAAEAEPAPAADVPDWLRATLGAPVEPEPAEDLPSPVELGAENDALAWLEALASKHGAKEDELVTPAETRNEEMPDWLRQTLNQGAVEETPAAPLAAVEMEAVAPEMPALEPEAPLAALPADDDALAWLEALAAKHGAKEDELLTPPESRSEETPSWLRQIQSEGESQSSIADEVPGWLHATRLLKDQAEAEPAEASPFEEPPAVVPEEAAPLAEPAAAEDNVVPDWLRDRMDQTVKVEEPPAAEEPAQPVALPAEGLPDWLTPPPAIEATEVAETTLSLTEGEGLGDDDALAWLEALASKHGASEDELVTPAEARSEEMPAWLQDAQRAAEAETPAAETVPGWLYTTRPLGESEAETPPAAPTFFAPPEAEPPTAAPEAVVEPVEEAAAIETVEVESEPVAPEAEEWPVWLNALRSKTGPLTAEPEPAAPTEFEPAAEEPAPPAALPAEELPDWLTPPPAAETVAAATEMPLGLSESEGLGDDDALAWLEGLAAKHGTKEEELVTPVESRSEAVPDWLREVMAEPQVEEIAEEAPAELAAPGEPLPDWLTPPAEDAFAAVPESPAVAEASDELEDTAPVPRVAMPEPVTAAREEVQAEAPPTPEAETEAEESWPQVAWPPAPPEEVQVMTAIVVQPKTGPLRSRTGALPAWPARRSVGPRTQRAPAQAEAPEVQLETARTRLQAGDADEALENYSVLIASNRQLDAVVADLEVAAGQTKTRRLLRTLGDAYMRQDRLQKALDTYKQALG